MLPKDGIIITDFPDLGKSIRGALQKSKIKGYSYSIAEGQQGI